MSAERAIRRATAASRHSPARPEVLDPSDEREPAEAAARAYDVYRRIGARVPAPTEGGNLTSLVIGLQPVERGWEVGEIKRLLFVAYLVARGRLRP